MKKIILASGSPRRKELLERLKLTFEVQISQIDEEAYEKTRPGQYVETLAFEKASDIAKHIDTDAIVIGCDTVVVLDNQILGKPANHEQAKDYLKALSGRSHDVYSGIAILDVRSGKQYIAHEITKVQMKSLDDYEIDHYITTGEPADKAGAYGIQGIGAVFIEGIAGDYYNVMGMPINRLYRGLRELGMDYFELMTP